MTDTSTTKTDRYLTLDTIRGVAVMGIFSVNVVGMAMIQQAYFYPPAFGFDTIADKLMWLGNFLFVDGKLRALFSIMFGASLMLVIDRAVAAGRSGWRTHAARMVVLMGIGLLHWTLLWWGDILTHYAAVGLVVALFARLSGRWLFRLAVAGLLVHAALGAFFLGSQVVSFDRAKASIAAGTATPERIKKVADEQKRAIPDASKLAADRANHQSIAAHVAWAAKEGFDSPLDLGPLWLETLPLMLLGMAGYKGGFLTGQWDRRRYRTVALWGLGIGFAAYAALAVYIYVTGFKQPYFAAAIVGFAPVFRPIMAVGYAALITLVARQGGTLTGRVAAVGRTAFTNYLACTIIGTLLFFGFGGDLYGKLSRFEAWLLVPPVWLAMLAWSKPWLDRFHYGPFEWLWRSLARLELQPMRRRPPLAPAIA